MPKPGTISSNTTATTADPAKISTWFSRPSKASGGFKTATGHFFRVNLRHHRLDPNRPADGKNQDHDARVIQRATQRTLRFIRWLRAWLYREAPWSAAIARLAAVWAE